LSMVCRDQGDPVEQVWCGGERCPPLFDFVCGDGTGTGEYGLCECDIGGLVLRPAVEQSRDSRAAFLYRVEEEALFSAHLHDERAGGVPCGRSDLFGRLRIESATREQRACRALDLRTDLPPLPLPQGHRVPPVDQSTGGTV